MTVIISAEKRGGLENHGGQEAGGVEMRSQKRRTGEGGARGDTVTHRKEESNLQSPMTRGGEKNEKIKASRDKKKNSPRRTILRWSLRRG